MTMSETKYIFLDVDGVLNTKAQWKRMYQLDYGCIERFVKFAKHLGKCNVILSSTWRNGYSVDGNHAPHVQELIQRLNRYDIRLIGKTAPVTDGDRAKEISTYITKHNLAAASCIVIDDDNTIFRSKLPDGCMVLWQDSAIGFSENIPVGIFSKIKRFMIDL